jgi:hypothetical protein
MTSDSRDELLRYLERKAFDPVLHAKAEGRSESEKRRLVDVQKRTRAEVERYHKYGSAQELVTNFKRDLSSEAAKKVHAELRSLGLPTIEDFREEFEQKARDLGVRAMS